MKKHPESDLEALREDLRQIYAGHPWHGSSISDVLEGIDARAAAERSVTRGHTIWELVLHMAVWTREVSSRLLGNAPKSPAEDWPEQQSGGGERAWRAARDDLASAQHDLERIVDGLNQQELTRWINDQRDPVAGAGATVGTLIRGLLQHYAYHQGQIAILKRAGERTGS
jgi:uncharacterized damage-inducible protein DinB